MNEKKNLAMVVDPDWKSHPEIYIESPKLPEEWCGMVVQWKNGYCPEPVFIAQFSFPEENIDVYLYGIRYETSNASVKGKTLPAGYFMEYLVLELNGNKVTHRLIQNKSVTYSSLPDTKDYVPVANLNKKRVEELSFRKPPSWKVEDAQWPTLNGNPMYFVGQAELIKNGITKSKLTWDEAVFLFWASQNQKAVFKITTQDLDYQSAEEHYNSE